MLSPCVCVLVNLSVCYLFQNGVYTLCVYVLFFPSLFIDHCVTSMCCVLCVSEWRVLHVALSDVLVLHHGVRKCCRPAHLRRVPLCGLDQETHVVYWSVSNTVQHNTIQCNTIQCNTTQHNTTTQYNRRRSQKQQMIRQKERQDWAEEQERRYRKVRSNWQSWDSRQGGDIRNPPASFRVQYNTIQYNTIQYNTITIQCNTMTMQCNAMQYNTVQCNKIQNCNTAEPLNSVYRNYEYTRCSSPSVSDQLRIYFPRREAGIFLMSPPGLES